MEHSTSVQMDITDLASSLLTTFIDKATQVVMGFTEVPSESDIRTALFEGLKVKQVNTKVKNSSKVVKEQVVDTKISYTEQEMKDSEGPRCWWLFTKGEGKKGNYCGRLCDTEGHVDTENQENNRCKICKTKGVKPTRKGKKTSPPKEKGVRTALPNDIMASSEDEKPAPDFDVSDGEPDLTAKELISIKNNTPVQTSDKASSKEEPVQADSDDEPEVKPKPKKKPVQADSDDEPEVKPKPKKKPVQSDSDDEPEVKPKPKKKPVQSDSDDE